MSEGDAGRAGEGPLQAKVLTASDGVVAGTREDRSGAALVEQLRKARLDVAEQRAAGGGGAGGGARGRRAGGGGAGGARAGEGGGGGGGGAGRGGGGPPPPR